MAAFDVPTPERFEREVLAAKEPTVVLFWAPWCPFCAEFRPVFERYAASRDGRFAVVHLDREDNPLWNRYQVDVVPTLAVFRGGWLVARRDGRLFEGLSERELIDFLREAPV